MLEDFTTLLSRRIWNNPQFQYDYETLHLKSIINTITGTGGAENSTISEETLNKLLQSAIYFASSPDPMYHQASYRIAVDAFNLFNNQISDLHKLLHIILGKLGNFPAVSYLYRIINKSKDYVIPSNALYELLQHENQNTILNEDQVVLLTDFQIKLWHAFNSESAVSVSAPTSAGKSYALQQFLINTMITDKYSFILYLVPTRALIHQVSDSIIADMNKFKGKFFVSTIPQQIEELELENGIFVLTQERAQILLEVNPNLKFDLVIVDEAQTICEGERGILLQIVIEKLFSRSSLTRFFFGSPYSKNPEYFSYILKTELRSLKENTSPVTQNLICLDINELQGRKLDISLLQDGAIIPITNILLEYELNQDESIFAYLSYYFGKNSKSLVYAGSPAKCEKIADFIKQWKEEYETDNIISDDLKEFAHLVREHIHKDYDLAKFIEYGIVFHYGKMPTILRKAIEYYYLHSKDIKFLVCTSTMLYGVNYPAKNLFIMKPSEGDKWLSSNAEPMRSTSFWNLAGRAGRLGKDFEGNVFLINKSKWKSDPTKGEKEQTIQSSLYNVIKNNSNDLLNITEYNHDAIDSTVESAFVKLYCDLKKGRLNQTIDRLPIEISSTFIEDFSKKCEEISFGVPDTIIENNLGISPFYQKKMLDYLNKCIAKGDYQKLIPLHPESSNNYTAYLRLFSRFEKYFEGRDKATNYPKRLAAIALEWMKGTPYPIIIKKSHEYTPKQSIQTTIRNIMETIENDLRFKLVRYSHCYNELLSFALNENKLEDLISSIAAVPLYLEIGACSITMINIIGLGISRTTAGLLNSRAANRSMNRSECITWLKKHDWQNSDLPKICKEEIISIISR